MKWRTLSETPVDSMIDFVVAECAKSGPIRIGTDSLQTGRFSQFVTIIAFPRAGGTGWRAIYSREVMPRITSLRQRLMKEVWMSVTIGMDLAPLKIGDLEIHIDANPSAKYMSNKYVQELVGMAMGQGFRAVIKPDSFIASHAADHIVRHHGKMPRAA